jgi:hypothetical protein
MTTKTILFGSLALLGCASACSPASGPGSSDGAGGASGGTAITGAGGGGGFLASGGDGPGPMFGNTGGGSQGGGGGDSCGSSNYKSTLLPANILFLVDRSGSMKCNLDSASAADCEAHPATKDPAQPTRWSVITSSLSSALDQIAAVPNTSVGLTFFSNDDVCGVTSKPNVDIAPLVAGGPQIIALKNALTNGNPKGGTPIIGGMILAFKHLHEQAQAPGNRFVVLVTDGADSCIATSMDGGTTHANYATQGITGDVVDRLLNTELPKAATVNIRTFVIGAPGSEPARGLLSKIAFAGNTSKNASCDHVSAAPAADSECHFDMTRSGDFATDLTAALQKITGQAVTCDFDVPTATDGKTVDTKMLNVDYFKAGGTTDADKTELVRDDTCTSAEPGWRFIDGSNETKIRICKSVCDTVQADPKANVVVSLSCKPQRVPR